MRRLIAGIAVLLAAGALVVVGGVGSTASGSDPTYKVELDNAFGLANGEQFKVAGVPAGTITAVDLDQKTLHALVTVQVTQSGFGSFHTDASCQSRPQSLIGEYFLNCDPGNSGPLLAPGRTIPVTQTQSTIPADLLQDVMRMPYRERLTLIINELGAAVAGNAQNLQSALQRAVPALTETDNLLNLLANDSHTLQDLTATSDSLVTALANRSADVQRFIDQANNIAGETATQQTALKGTFQQLPGFLEQLRPALQRLGQATDANTPVLDNLNASAGQIDTLLTVLPSFSRAARPAIKSLGRASVTGKVAVIAARPTVQHLNAFAQPTPELAQNLSIVLHSLDDRSRAVEKDPRSPGGQGYTGLEALLQYVFNQTLDLDYLGPWGHVQAINIFVNPACSPYATPGTVANQLALQGASVRNCYAFLGPNQPGVNEADPSNPGGCAPDPGGVQPGYKGPTTSACKLSAAKASTASSRTVSSSQGNNTSSYGSASATNLGSTVGQLLGAVGAGGSSSSSSSGSPAASAPAPSSSSSSTGTTPAPSSPNQAQQLLNYLLSP